MCRKVVWGESGITYEADPKHRELVFEFFGFCGKTKVSKYNGHKEEREVECEGEALGKEEGTAFRAVAARLNYLSLDCPDLQFPIKECSREMANPTRGSWAKLKKVARYMVGRQRAVWEFNWLDEPEEGFFGR